MSTEDTEKKLLKVAGGKEFREEVQGLAVDALEARITALQMGLEESRTHKEENEDLRAAKDEVALLSGPYKDVEVAVRIKTKFLIDLIKEKGGA